MEGIPIEDPEAENSLEDSIESQEDVLHPLAEAEGSALQEVFGKEIIGDGGEGFFEKHFTSRVKKVGQMMVLATVLSGAMGVTLKPKEAEAWGGSNDDRQEYILTPEQQQQIYDQAYEERAERKVEQDERVKTRRIQEIARLQVEIDERSNRDTREDEASTHEIARLRRIKQIQDRAANYRKNLARERGERRGELEANPVFQTACFFLGCRR